MNIQINNIKKTFGEKVAVDIDNFVINNGEILGLVGNNGAGKSTLFRLILDLIKADEGSVTMEHEGRVINVADTEEWKEWTAAYIDDSFIIDYLTPDEYLQFVARISNIDEEAYAEQMKHYEHFMAGEILGQKKLIRNLSAGNKQKVGIVAALMLRPRILILDEPFNFLDPSSQNAIKHLLQEYNQETGAIILVSSHNLNHTVDICPRIALLENGRIIRDIDNHDGSAERELENYFEVN
ncbi:MAG: ATP-binding cassette domain-containing protein [Bacteroidaceae bacterium]|nr:ATP-binding cassette domain-containing protein [Bacteroidaceae bacterium]